MSESPHEGQLQVEHMRTMPCQSETLCTWAGTVAWRKSREKNPSLTEFVFLYKSENNCSGDRWEHKAEWKYFYVVQALNSKEDVHWQSMAGCTVFISPSIFFGTGAINKNRAAPSLWSPEEVSWLWRDSVNIRTDAILKGSMPLIMFPCPASSIYFCLIVSNVELCCL